MAKFRKKPVVIEAVKWEPSKPPTAYPEWVWAEVSDTQRFDSLTGTLRISTLEGDMLAQPGDWIIRGVMGEIYPCKPHIFDATYEPA